MNAPTLAPLPSRADDSHKGDFGRVLVIAGSTGMTGSGALACLAALRSGAGLVTWAIPQSLNMIAESLALEVITLPVPDTKSCAPSVDAREDLLEASREVSAVILGPGLPVAGETGELIRLLIPEIHAPLILDAGGLRAIGIDTKGIRKRRAETIVLPHPGEMAGMTGKSIPEIQDAREETAKSYAADSGAVVLLKGARSVISNGEQTYINQTGNPGMATAGSGDVLAGVIAALVGQGMSAYEATCLGAHLHGAAGDIACDEIGQHGLIASDIIASLPEAFQVYQQVGDESK